MKTDEEQVQMQMHDGDQRYMQGCALVRDLEGLGLEVAKAPPSKCLRLEQYMANIIDPFDNIYTKII